GGYGPAGGVSLLARFGTFDDFGDLGRRLDRRPRGAHLPIAPAGIGRIGIPQRLLALCFGRLLRRAARAGGREGREEALKEVAAGPPEVLWAFGRARGPDPAPRAAPIVANPAALVRHRELISGEEDDVRRIGDGADHDGSTDAERRGGGTNGGAGIRADLAADEAEYALGDRDR